MAKILVVDDDQDLRNLIVDILFDAGYDVVEAKDGPAALDQAVQEEPDLILLDVRMPQMDGFEVLDILKTFPNTESIPVVMLTALPPVKGELAAWRMGVRHYIPKPFSSNRVELTVKVALREALENGGRDEDDVHAMAWQGSGAQRPAIHAVSSDGPIRTGSRELDRLLEGGIPLCSLTLVEGNAQTGKSVLGQHIAYEALLEGHRVSYFVSDNTEKGIIAQMGAIGLDVKKYSESGMLSFAPLEDQESSDASCDLGQNADALLDLSAQELGRVPNQNKIVIVDHVTNLFTFSDERAILRFLATCKRLSADGRAIVVMAQSHAFDSKMLARARDLSDAHFSLVKEKMGMKLGTTLEIVKSNGVELYKDNTISFEILAGLGISMMAFGKARV